MKIARLSFLRLGYAGSIVLIVVSTVGAHAQTTSAPIKQGLWQTQMTMSMQVTLPPDVEAKIAAMPAAQQAQMRSMMGGPGAKPTTSTVKSCVASTMTPSDLLNQAQQKGGMTCKFTNQQVTASAISFDISCTTTQGTASGHAQFTMADSERERTVDECDHGRHIDLYVPGRGLRRREAGFAGGSDGAVSAQPRPEV
jgi:hypothetical protein